MKIRCKHVLIALIGANISVVSGGYFAARRLADVAAVQASIERNVEINFDGGGRPPLLPVWADNALQKIIDDMIGPQIGRFSGPDLRRSSVSHDRLLTLFRGRITEIEIWYPERMREDLGAALARLPSLKRVAIHEAAFSREDWESLFSGLTSHPSLEVLEVGGPALNDRAIEPLGESAVRRLVIYEGSLAEFSPATLARMRHLSELTIATTAIATSDVDPPMPETQRMIREALPNVKVSFE